MPADVLPTHKVRIAALTQLKTEIGKLELEIARRAKEQEVASDDSARCLPADRDDHSAPGPGLYHDNLPLAVKSGRRHEQDERTIPAAPANHRYQQRYYHGNSLTSAYCAPC